MGQIRYSIFIVFLLGSLLGCAPSKSSDPTAPIFQSVVAQQCVQIYYDAPAGPVEPYGQIHGQILENLLGHFPHLKVHTYPIESYQAGDIDRCATTFYIGSYFDNAIPQAFLTDYSSNRQTVVWLGYSIWQLSPQQLKTTLGINYLSISTLDKDHFDEFQRPTFFKNVHYKGEVFEKYGEFDFSNQTSFNSAFEISKVEVVDNQTKVLAEIEHNFTHEHAPYALQKGSRFYLADVPFSYIHEADRYLVFADLLFDILHENPLRSDFHPAVFRLEDVNALTLPYTIRRAVSIAKEQNVPIHLATIPFFTDPYGIFDEPANDQWKPI